MAFEDVVVYTVGDIDFLEQVFISLAMLFDSSELASIFRVALMLGVLMVFLASLFKGAGRLDFQQVLLGFILFSILFVPKTNVLLYDTYTDDIRPVDNIPVGIAMAGGIISKMGYVVTENFELGYSGINGGISGSKFTESLQVLSDIRQEAHSSAVIDAYNIELGGGYVDIRKSLDNYIRDCTMIKMDLGLETVDGIFRSDISESLKFDSDLYVTKLHLVPNVASGVTYTCRSGYAAIAAAIPKIATGATLDAWSDSMGVDDAKASLTTTLQSLSDTATNAQNYMFATVVEPIYLEAAAGKYTDMQDYSAAIMVNQAIQQRNSAWTAKQSMFTTIVRPMMTFFEAFVYAATPMMAIMVLFGQVGTQVIVRFAQTILWLQLWYPTLSIINLFLTMAASKEIGSITNVTYPELSSFYALNAASDRSAHWLAVGGYLASATPALAMFLVSGASSAVAGIAGKMSSSTEGAKIDTSSSSPEILRTGALEDFQSRSSGDSIKGAAVNGADSLFANFNASSMLGSSVSSASAAAEQASASFGQDLSSFVKNGSDYKSQLSRAASVGKMINSSESSGYDTLKSMASDYMKAHNIDASHRDAVTGQLAANLSGHLGKSIGLSESDDMLGGLLGSGEGSLVTPRLEAPGGDDADFEEGGKDKGFVEKMANKAVKAVGVNGGIRGQVGLGIADQTTDAAGTSTKTGSTDKSGWAFSQKDSSDLRKQLAADIKQSDVSSWTNSSSTEDSAALKRSASESVSATNTYQEASSLAQQAGSGSSMKGRELAAMVAGNKSSQKMLSDALRMAPSSVRANAAQLANMYESQFGIESNQAVAMGALTAITSRGNYANDKDFISGSNAAGHAITAASGINVASGGDPLSKEGVKQRAGDTTPRFGSLENETLGLERQQYKAPPKPHSDSIPTDPIPGGDGVVSDAESKAKGIKDLAQDKRNEVMAKPLAEATNALLANSTGGPATMSAAKLAGTLDNASDFLSNYVGKLGGALAGFGAGAGSELSNGLSAAGEKGMEAFGQYYAEHRDDAYNMLKSKAEGLGLTPAQQEVYASSFMIAHDELRAGQLNPFEASQSQISADRNLKMEYAERDSEGNVMLDENNNPVLSKENEKLTDAIISNIRQASEAGDVDGSYMNRVVAYNIANDKKDF